MPLCRIIWENEMDCINPSPLLYIPIDYYKFEKKDIRVWNKSDSPLVHETEQHVPPPYSLHRNPDSS